MYQVSLKSEGGRPFFVITWPGITQDRKWQSFWKKTMSSMGWESNLHHQCLRLRDTVCSLIFIMYNLPLSLRVGTI